MDKADLERCLLSLTKGKMYTFNELENHFGTTLTGALCHTIQRYAYFKFIRGDKLLFAGLYKNLTPKVRIQTSCLAKVAKIAKNIKLNIPKLILNQTYSSQDLINIFNVKFSDGLLEYLAPYVVLRQLPDKNYKVTKFLLEFTPLVKSYNAYILAIVDTLIDKYDNGDFLFTVADIPLSLRKMIPPGLIPRILDFLIREQILVTLEQQHRSKRYRIHPDLLDNASKKP